MAIETIQIAGFVGCSDYTPSSLAQGWQDFRTSAFFTVGDDITQLPFGVFYETDILKMEKVNDGNDTLNIYIRTNPLDDWVLGGIVSTVSMNALGLLFAIDNDTQKASIFTCVNIPGGYYSIDSRTTFYKNDTSDMYYVLTNSLPVLYNWQSVQSITGKNKTVSLTTLKEESINDGSPVDDATSSAFNNAPNSCSVGGIVSVDLPIVDDNPLSIAVKYNIPELTDSVYTSCKVVAKKNKIPKSKTDGDKILDVSPSSHGCVIRGLEQETKYYVVVFVEDSFGNKAESEPGGPVRTGKQSGIFLEIIQIAKPGIEDRFIEEIEVNKIS